VRTSPINKRILKYCLAGILWLCLTMLNAQNSDEFGAWNLFGLEWETNDKISFMGDIQMRSSAFYRQFYHVETKFNVLYDLNDWITLVPGIGKYIDYTKGGDFIKPLTQNETRFWEEIRLEWSLSRFSLENRTRLEQRFTSDGYRNRLRMRFGLDIPLTNSILKTKTLYASAYDDIFYLKDIEINRIYVGLGYDMYFGSIQAGWLHQVKYTSDVKEYLNAMFVLMIFEIKNKNI